MAITFQQANAVFVQSFFIAEPLRPIRVRVTIHLAVIQLLMFFLLGVENSQNCLLNMLEVIAARMFVDVVVAASREIE